MMVDSVEFVPDVALVGESRLLVKKHHPVPPVPLFRDGPVEPVGELRPLAEQAVPGVGIEHRPVAPVGEYGLGAEQLRPLDARQGTGTAASSFHFNGPTRHRSLRSEQYRRKLFGGHPATNDCFGADFATTTGFL